MSLTLLVRTLNQVDCDQFEMFVVAYADKAEAASNSAAQKFNCAQRKFFDTSGFSQWTLISFNQGAHQNTLEHAPYVLYR